MVLADYETMGAHAPSFVKATYDGSAATSKSLDGASLDCRIASAEFAMSQAKPELAKSQNAGTARTTEAATAPAPGQERVEAKPGPPRQLNIV